MNNPPPNALCPDEPDLPPDSGCLPLIGWGNRFTNDTSSEIALLAGNPLVSVCSTPKWVPMVYPSYVWWEPNATTVGISIAQQSAIWHSNEVACYVAEVAYPAQSSGMCAFAVLPRIPDERERTDRLWCLQMPYSSASLEKLLKLCSVLSVASPRPTIMRQWADSK